MPVEQLNMALDEGQLVVVLGPGIDRGAGLPDRAELARELAAAAEGVSIEQLLAEDRLGEAFGELEFALGRADLRRRIIDRLSDGYTLSPVLTALGQLHDQLRAIVTTSLVDGLLNRALQGRWPIFDEPRPQLAQRRRLVFHLRGTLGRPERWVLTDEQEERELRAESGRGALMSAIYHAHRMVLIGFELDDPALRSLLRVLPAVEPGDAPAHFMLYSGACEAPTRRRLAARGFELLSLAAEDWLAQVVGDQGTDDRAGTGECPYPGLEAFGEDRAGFFFGRHMEVSQAAARLGEAADGSQRRWLAVEGPSGVGKSSFVHAGVVPALRRGYAKGAPLRWQVATMRPGQQPFRSLARSLYAALGPSEAPSLDDKPEALRDWVERHTPAGCGVLLILDQLEEAVTLSEASALEPFTQALVSLLESAQLYIISTIRSDFVAALIERLPGLASSFNERAERYALPPISRVGLREAIVEPAAREGVRIEPQLVETMLADADPGADIDEQGEARATEAALPLVAHVLRALWDAGAASDRLIELREYLALGGIRGALSQSAEGALAGLDRDAIARAESLLLGLVRVENDQSVTRRTLDRTEAIARAGGAPLGEQLLLRLSGYDGAARLIVVRREGERELVELVHEALLRDWERYRGLIGRNRRQLLLDDELERRARRWERAGRPAEDLPAGQEMADLLDGRPHGAEAELQREFQQALSRGEEGRKRSERGRVLAWVSAAGAVVAAGAIGVLALNLDDQTYKLALETAKVSIETQRAKVVTKQVQFKNRKLSETQDELVQAQEDASTLVSAYRQLEGPEPIKGIYSIATVMSTRRQNAPNSAELVLRGWLSTLAPPTKWRSHLTTPSVVANDNGAFVVDGQGGIHELPAGVRPDRWYDIPEHGVLMFYHDDSRIYVIGRKSGSIAKIIKASEHISTHTGMPNPKYNKDAIFIEEYTSYLDPSGALSIAKGSLELETIDYFSDPHHVPSEMLEVVDVASEATPLPAASLLVSSIDSFAPSKLPVSSHRLTPLDKASIPKAIRQQILFWESGGYEMNGSPEEPWILHTEDRDLYTQTRRRNMRATPHTSVLVHSHDGGQTFTERDLEKANFRPFHSRGWLLLTKDKVHDFDLQSIKLAPPLPDCGNWQQCVQAFAASPAHDAVAIVENGTVYVYERRADTYVLLWQDTGPSVSKWVNVEFPDGDRGLDAEVLLMQTRTQVVAKSVQSRQTLWRTSPIATTGLEQLDSARTGLAAHREAGIVVARFNDNFALFTITDGTPISQPISVSEVKDVDDVHLEVDSEGIVVIEGKDRGWTRHALLSEDDLDDWLTSLVELEGRTVEDLAIEAATPIESTR